LSLECFVRGSFFSFYPRYLFRIRSHDVVAAIDVDHFAGNARRHRATEEDCGVSDFAASTLRPSGARSAWCFNIVLKSETPRAKEFELDQR
jgi:hypothetical protein